MKAIIKRVLSKIRGEQNLEKLKKRGLKIGKNPHIMSTAIIDSSHCWHIEIGDDFRLGHYSQIIAHDASTKYYFNYTRVANVKIGNNVHVATGVIILPGVTIGDNVIIGAGSIVTKDIPNNSIAVGVPARVISTLDVWMQKEKEKMKPENTFSEEFTVRNKDFSEKHHAELLKSCMEFKEIFVE